MQRLVAPSPFSYEDVPANFSSLPDSSSSTLLLSINHLVVQVSLQAVVPQPTRSSSYSLSFRQALDRLKFSFSSGDSADSHKHNYQHRKNNTNQKDCQPTGLVFLSSEGSTRRMHFLLFLSHSWVGIGVHRGGKSGSFRNGSSQQIVQALPKDRLPTVPIHVSCQEMGASLIHTFASCLFL